MKTENIVAAGVGIAVLWAVLKGRGNGTTADLVYEMNPFNARFLSPKTNVQAGKPALGIVGLQGENFAGGMLGLNYPVLQGRTLRFSWDALVPTGNPEDRASAVLWYNPGGTAVIGLRNMPRNGKWTGYSARIVVLGPKQGPSGSILVTVSLLLSANYQAQAKTENVIHVRNLRVAVEK